MKQSRIKKYRQKGETTERVIIAGQFRAQIDQSKSCKPLKGNQRITLSNTRL